MARSFTIAEIAAPSRDCQSIFGVPPGFQSAPSLNPPFIIYSLGCNHSVTLHR
jgi:hypothetical protein